MSATYREDKPHLWDCDPPGNRAGSYDSDGEHEARCTINSCHARITIDPSDGTEYGHRYGCPHRPDSLPNTMGSGLRDVEDFTCAVCGRGDFSSDKSLRSHISAAHGKACHECGETFNTSRERSDHIAREHGDDPSECPICSKWFETPDARESHIPRAHGTVCRECWTVFDSAEERDQHHAREHGDDPCECPTCGQWLPAPASLATHSGTVHDYPCPECGEEFEDDAARTNHVAFVHDGADRTCPVCQRWFAGENTLMRHLGTAHENPCRECGEEFDTDRKRRTHYIDEHTDADEPSFCPACDMVFETDGGVSSHLGKAHEFACGECGEEFDSERARRYHKLSEHTASGEIAECPTCGEPFAGEALVKSHHKKVHDESLIERVECADEDCETTFLKNKSDRRFCSSSCAGKQQETVRLERECPICGDPYEVTPSQDEKRTTCGDPECSNEYQTLRFEETCTECGSEFRNSFGTVGVTECWDCRSDDAPESTQPGAAEETSSGGVAGD